ncbi:MAG TPA: energy transducer TonB [Blastocatellia bacterium]|nr:energy transducer TonB [Blastocatellia bacterium]
MNLAVIIPAAVLLLARLSAHHVPLDRVQSVAQNPLRVAVIGIAREKANDAHPIEAVLAEGLSRDARVALIDEALVRPALAGIGYDGSINMSKDEARRVAAAIGCDFFIVGKTEALTRSARENESHEEAYVGVMIVDAKTGSLAAFDFVSAKGDTREAALDGLAKTLSARVPGYVNQLTQLNGAAKEQIRIPARSEGGERIEDMPDEGSLRAVGFAPPEFLTRVKPEYGPEAEQANITATVEAMVVFRLNGEVGRCEIIRWAGFGLEESAERAIRQLKFKPATRDGKPVSIRALIRYNFRRVSEPISKPAPPSPKPPEKPEKDMRDLRQLMKPSYRRPA